jgi:RHS repeat-associated protein
MKGGTLSTGLLLWLVAAASSVAADSATFTHDANGNLTSRTEAGVEWVYAYDARDQLREVRRDGVLFEVYRYDAQGRRVRKTSADGVVRYVWDGNRIVQETDDAGNTIASYHYVGDRLVSVDHVTEGTGFYVLDGLGSPVGLVRADGSVAARYHLDAWGVLRAEEGDYPNPFRFTGHQFDEATGLYYAKARYYDPDTGRFLSEDSAEGLADTPASLHRYLYANDNPTTYVDPDGRVVVLQELRTLLEGAREEAPEASTGPFTGPIDRTTIRATNRALFGLGAEAVGLANLGVNALVARHAPTSHLAREAQAELHHLSETIESAVQGVARLVAEDPFGTGHKLLTLPSSRAVAGIDTANRLPYLSEREITTLMASGIELGIEAYAGAKLARIGGAGRLALEGTESPATAASDLSRIPGRSNPIGERGPFIVTRAGVARTAEGIVRLERRGFLKFQGIEVRAARDLSHLSERALRAMAEEGFAARDAAGNRLVLHHLNQNPAGPVVEIPAPRHRISNRVQHPLGNAPGVGLSREQREAFDLWREAYWRARATEELSKRNLK